MTNLKETANKSGPLKRCSGGGGGESKSKRSKCPYPVFDSDYFYPSQINQINRNFCNGGPGPDASFEFPEETYLEETKPLNFTKGEKLPVDLFTLLSNSGKTSSLVRNNGKKVGLTDAVAGKFLVICCFFVPMLATDTPPDVCRALIATYNDLKKKQQHIDFEMVMVAKMRNSFIAEEEEEVAFDRFFSAFPCLDVPFSESYTRDLICKLLGLGMTGRRESDACLVVGPDQKVLQTDAFCFEDFGAASFPFTDEHLESIEKEDEVVRMRLDPIYKELKLDGEISSSVSVTLEELLCCVSSTLLHKCCGGQGSSSSEKKKKKVISVAELSKSKCVALYLCFDGEFMSCLESFRKRCVKRKLEFEVVIVHLACFSEESSYFEAFKSSLEKKGISSRWELPFVDQVSRRLYRIANSPCEDNVMIWAGGGGGGELNGVALMEWCGSRNLYPVTRKKWLDDRLSSLRSLTLESFLGKNDRVYYPGRGHLKVSDLKNRNILIYFDSSDVVYKKLRGSYEEIKVDYPGSEVVFVPMRHPNRVSDMPWPQLSSPVARRPEGLWFDPILVAFGDDNQIKSLHAQDRLNYKKEGVSMFDDTLRREVLGFLISELQR